MRKPEDSPERATTEIVAESPDRLAPGVMKEISAVELTLQKVADMSEARLAAGIRRYAEQATGSARDAAPTRHPSPTAGVEIKTLTKEAVARTERQMAAALG